MPDMHGFYHGRPEKTTLFDNFKNLEACVRHNWRWDLSGGLGCSGSRNELVVLDIKSRDRDNSTEAANTSGDAETPDVVKARVEEDGSNNKRVSSLYLY